MHSPIAIPMPQLPPFGMPPLGVPSAPAPMTISQMAAAQAHTFMAQRAPRGVLGCPSCNATEGGPQLKDIAPTSLWARIPLWAKIIGGVALVGGVGFLAYKLTR